MEQNQITKVLAYFLIVFCGFILCCAFVEYMPIIIISSGFLWGIYLLKNKNKNNDTNKIQNKNK